MRNWWTPKDLTASKKTAALVAQYSALKYFLTWVKWREFTQRENIEVILEAYQ
jgi:predicted metalloendopeptidase